MKLDFHDYISQLWSESRNLYKKYNVFDTSLIPIITVLIIY